MNTRKLREEEFTALDEALDQLPVHGHRGFVEQEMPMKFSGISVILTLIIFYGGLGYLIFLLIKALKKYIKSEPVRKEKERNAKSLGEILKKHRTECRMTQEFVAEAIGVSRQAVSKWENGAFDPSTTNLIALAGLFKIAPEELMREIQ